MVSLRYYVQLWYGRTYMYKMAVSRNPVFLSETAFYAKSTVKVRTVL